jgi:uncharacterized protein YggE
MKRTVSVVGSASVSVAPDCARLNCGVQVTGANAQDVLRRSNSAMQSIIDALGRHGVEPIDLRTHGPNLYPTDSGYGGSNDVTVVIRQIDKVGDVIDAVAEAGGPNLTMHGLTFEVSDPGTHLPSVRAAAIDAARTVAGQLASAAGAAVGAVVAISDSSGSQGPVPIARAAMAMSKATPVEPGGQQIRVDISVTYRLVDAEH